MDRDALRRRIKDRLDQLVEEAFASAHSPRTIDEIEALAVELGERARAEIAQELAEAATSQAQEDPRSRPAQKIRCGCGRFARYKGERRRTLVTMAGEVKLSRSYFYCRRCDAGFCPSDRSLGLSGGGFTRRVAQEVARLCALLPFAQAVELLWQLCGVSVSAKQAQRLTQQAGEVLCGYLHQRHVAAFCDRIGVCSAAAVMYVEADGVQTPMREGWRETKIGLVRRLRADGSEMGPTQYVSHLGECETFGEAWYTLAAHAGVEQAREVVVLGDGSAWIWNQAAFHFPQAVQILDFWHAAERLWEMGRSAFGVGSEAGQAWARAQQERLLEGKWEALSGALEALAHAYPLVGELVGETLGYYANNRSRMNYACYRQRGWSIGSGAAESGCKQIITQRLKGAGMRWREAGAQTIARLRCLLLGEQWKDFLAFWKRDNAQALLAPLA